MSKEHHSNVSSEPSTFVRLFLRAHDLDGAATPTVAQIVFGLTWVAASIPAFVLLWWVYAIICSIATLLAVVLVEEGFVAILKKRVARKYPEYSEQLKREVETQQRNKTDSSPDHKPLEQATNDVPQTLAAATRRAWFASHSLPDVDVTSECYEAYQTILGKHGLGPDTNLSTQQAKLKFGEAIDEMAVVLGEHHCGTVSLLAFFAMIPK